MKISTTIRTTMMTIIIMLQLLPLLLLQSHTTALYIPGEHQHQHHTDTSFVSSSSSKKTTPKEAEQQHQQEATFIPITGETIPSKVIDYTIQKSTNDNYYNDFNNNNNNPNHPFYFWLDRLGTESMKLVQDQIMTNDATTKAAATTTTTTTCSFSLLSWNILCETYYHRQKEKLSQQYYFPWKERLSKIMDTLQSADADIVCLQEVDYDSYQTDVLPQMINLGYTGVVQGSEAVVEIKRRKNKNVRAHVVATFWKEDRFVALEGLQQQQQQQQQQKQPKRAAAGASKSDHPKKKKNKPTKFAHMARGRTLTSLLQQRDNDAILSVMNCHLEGHPRQYAARIRQLQHGMQDLVKYTTTSSSTSSSSSSTKLNAFMVAGDFNCELGRSASSTYLQMGRVGKKSSLGGVHGTSATWAIPPCILECDEATSVLNPILEWNHPLPDDELDKVPPHPFRRNSLLSAYSTEEEEEKVRRRRRRRTRPDKNNKQRSNDDDDDLLPSLFTYCANPYKPVAGLDQIWYSGWSLQRIALRTLFTSEDERQRILQHGLPLAPLYPSDHLPIGAVMNWKTTTTTNDDDDEDNNKNNSKNKLRELIIMEQNRTPKSPKPKSPIMAYAELDQLLVIGPFDSDQQRLECEAILDATPTDLPDNPKEKPTEEQLQILKEVRERKQALLNKASEPTKVVLQRIFKLKKNVAVY